PEDLFVVPFGEDDPLGIALGFVDDVPGDLFGAPLGGFEVFDIFGHVLDGLAGNATVHGGLGNGRGDVEQDAGVERFGDDVFPAEREFDVAVGFVDGVGYFFPGQFGQGMNRSQFHFFIDGAGMDV